MRGRKPCPLQLPEADRRVLQAVAHQRRLCWFQVQHARIVLASAAGEPVQQIASELRCDRTTVWRVCRRYERGGLSELLLDDPRLGRPQEISPLQRAQIVALACLEPVARGLHLTHWASPDLARQAVADGIVEAISPRTVRRILDEADLQPHRTRYWRTARLDDQFKQRAEKVLWCYGQAERLARAGLWTVAVDEKPNFQVLERRPIRWAVPHAIEQREFEYTRHGTVNLLFFLVVHSGQMAVAIEARKDAEHYLGQLRAFQGRHPGLRGVYLIQDGDPSHTAAATEDYLRGGQGWWRPRFTPAHASWLNQAELLMRAFAHRYLKRGSWASRDELIAHVRAAAAEYNRRYAHPFEWTWTNQKMRQWFAKHTREFVA